MSPNTGCYFLEIGTAKALRTQAGIELPALAGGQLNIEVNPRDPARLQRICADLERQVLKFPGASSYEAVTTLSHIHDPVAVPFLARLLGARAELAPVLAQGLGRIANGPAVDALIAHVNDESEDRRNAARSALSMIERETRDPATLQKIQDSRR